MKNIKRDLIAGLLLVTPLIATIVLISWMVQLLDTYFIVFIENMFKIIIPKSEFIFKWKIGGIVLSFMLLVFVGILGRNILGNKLISYGSRLIQKIPIVGGIYSSVKQISDNFSLNKSDGAGKPVLVEYPNEGIFTIGFMTSKNDIIDVSGYYYVFIPTTPNPTSGMLVSIHESKIKNLNMSTDNAIKVIMSGGMFKNTKGGDPNIRKRNDSNGTKSYE